MLYSYTHWHSNVRLDTACIISLKQLLQQMQSNIQYSKLVLVSDFN